MRLKDADALIELIDDDIAALNKDMSREGYDVCLCTLQMIKQYIKALPTIEAVPLEDYRCMEQTVYKLTQALAEAEPIKHGRWVEDALPFNGNALKVYRCTACGEPFWTNPPGYCPHCGAKMDEPEAEPCASD